MQHIHVDHIGYVHFFSAAVYLDLHSYRATICYNAAVIVCLSVCLSVTRRNFIETDERIELVLTKKLSTTYRSL